MESRITQHVKHKYDLGARSTYRNIHQDIHQNTENTNEIDEMITNTQGIRIDKSTNSCWVDEQPFVE